MKLIKLLGLSLVLSSTAIANNHKHFTADQVNEVGQIVREYLLENPEILIEVSEKLQQQQAALQQQQAEQALTSLRNEIFLDKNTQVVGNLDGRITLVEYFDYQCGFCKRQQPIIKELIANNPDLRVVYKQLPIFGGESNTAARAVLAAFYAGLNHEALHNALMVETERLSDESIMQTAANVGISNSELEQALAKHAEQIDQELGANYEQAQAIGISGTPALVLGETQAKSAPEFIPGFSELAPLQNKIDQLN